MKTRTLILVVTVLLVLQIFAAQVQSGNSGKLPVASFTYSPNIPAPEETITFDASASYDPDGRIAQYVWDFGDGNVVGVTNPTVTHAYPVDGNYTVELTVTDNTGSTAASTAVVQVSTVVFFRVVIAGTLIPVANVKVTTYYNDGSAWVKAPAEPDGFEIKYDNMTQPNLANTAGQRYRNPGYTASILRDNASNIGFDIHPSCWIVYFKFEWGSFVAYWPNDTVRVYSYNYGAVEARNYLSNHQPYYDPTAGTYVIKVYDIPKGGVSPTSTHPIIVGINCPPPTQKYYLTVKTAPTSITTIPGEGWYVNGTDAALTAPDYVSVSSSSRYRFSYWDVDGTSRGAGINPITVRMNANHSATAHYVLQYSVVFSQSGLSSDATGTVVTVNSAVKNFTDLPYTLWVDSGSSVTYSYGSTVSSTVAGKRFRLNSVLGSTSPITVVGPVTVTGNYVIQYLITFAQTGLDSTATGTVVTVNGSAKVYSDLPFNSWVDAGATVTYSYSSIVSSTVSGKQFRLTAVNCPPSQFVVTGPATVTGVYCTQYKVTFTQSGLDSTASGTVVTVNGSAKTFSTLPYSFWVDSGSSVTYSYSAVVASSTVNKQFKLNSVSGSSSSIIVTGPTTVMGNYVTQYLVAFTQSGLDSTATGTVVTVNGSSKSFTNLPYTLWVDSGGSVTYSYGYNISSSVSGKRFALSSVAGSASPITVTGPTTVTGNYVTQYLVTFAQSGLDSTASGTVVTANGTAKVFADLPYALWVDNGAGVPYSYSSIVSSSTPGKQFRLNNVTGLASPITVTGPVTVTGNYVTQYAVTFTYSGLDSSATGGVATVNGNLKGYADLPFILWVDSGSSVTYTYNDVVLSTVSGKRFKQVSVSGPSSPITVTGAVTITGNYKTQYQIIFDQTGVGTDFTGTVATVDSINYNVSGLPALFWLDQGSSHNFSFASPLTVNASKQYSWSSTSGLSTLQNGTLTISTSGNVIGNYIVQNCVTFDQAGVSSDFNGTVVVVDGTPYGVGSLSVSFYWQLGSVHTFAFQSPLVVTANDKQYVWTNTAGLSTLQSGSINVTAFGRITGYYKTQYYLSLPTNPQGVVNPSGSGWYDSGTYASISTDQYVYGGSRWRFAGWTTSDMSEITDPLSPSTTVLVDTGKTVTANYVHQHLITFTHTGLASDATGTVLTVNGTAKSYADLPYGVWSDDGDIVAYSYQTTVPSSISGKRFYLTGITGPASPITVAADVNVTGNYKTQYCLTVSSPYATPGGQGWYDSGATAYATLGIGVVDHGNGTRHVFTNWNGDATGTGYASSDPITMNGPKTAVANWKTQYSVAFTHSGLDSSASGTVATIDSVPVTFGQLPYTVWVDAGNSVTYSYNNVSSLTTGKKFVLIGVSGPSSPITVATPMTITGNYKTQYQITFNQSGVSNDFTGTIVTVDGTDYNYSTLPAYFWWDSGSAHNFAFASPLIVNLSKQYDWDSTSGLTTLQNGTLTISGSGSVTGNYVVQADFQITFAQTGVGANFTGTVIVIDGVNYNLSQLPASFWWVSGSIHTFAYQSPLVEGSNVTQYVWISTNGLSTAQSGSITVTVSGSVTGNYKTQYYLNLATSSPGVASPSGAGWYDSGSSAPISTDAFIDIVPNSSRYRFNGWTTTNMTEILGPNWSPTTVLMDESKTVTANYAIQYNVSFAQTGVNSDFTDTIVTVDGRTYNFTELTASFWWDKDSIHTFSFASPLPVNASTQYVWTSTSGLSTSQSGSITITASGSVTGNYRVGSLYALTIQASTGGITNPALGTHTYQAGATIPVTAIADVNYQFDYWELDSVNMGVTNPFSVLMNMDHTLKAVFRAVPATMSVSIGPLTSTIRVNESVTFTSSVAGGITPYRYQWYLDGSPVAGATLPTWVFTATHNSVHLVYLKVTDSHSNTANSQTATVNVVSVPVGGYSVSLARQTPMYFLALYTALVALFAVVLSVVKRKRR